MTYKSMACVVAHGLHWFRQEQRFCRQRGRSGPGWPAMATTSCA